MLLARASHRLHTSHFCLLLCNVHLYENTMRGVGVTTYNVISNFSAAAWCLCCVYKCSLFTGFVQLSFYSFAFSEVVSSSHSLKYVCVCSCHACNLRVYPRSSWLVLRHCGNLTFLLPWQNACSSAIKSFIIFVRSFVFRLQKNRIPPDRINWNRCEDVVNVRCPIYLYVMNSRSINYLFICWVLTTFMSSSNFVRRWVSNFCHCDAIRDTGYNVAPFDRAGSGKQQLATDKSPQLCTHFQFVCIFYLRRLRNAVVNSRMNAECLRSYNHFVLRPPITTSSQVVSSEYARMRDIDGTSACKHFINSKNALRE